MEITIHDSGSLGAIFLTHLLQKDGWEPELVWKERFLPSFLPAKVGGVQVNNGLHVLDYPRGEKLIQAFEEISGTKASLVPKNSWLYIAGFCFSSRAQLADWPPSLLAFLRIPGPRASLLQAQENLDAFLLNFVSRFSDSWEDSRHLFIPWFYPANHSEYDGDEGALYRDTIRKGFGDGKVAVFGDGSMQYLRSILYRGLRPKSGSTAPSAVESVEAIDSAKVLGIGDRAFTLAVFRFSTSRPPMFGAFDEILVADQRLISLNRIWFIEIDGAPHAVCELYRKSAKTVDAAEQEQLIEILESLFDSRGGGGS
jgi:hypothetical protein